MLPNDFHHECMTSCLRFGGALAEMYQTISSTSLKIVLQLDRSRLITMLNLVPNCMHDVASVLLHPAICAILSRYAAGIHQCICTTVHSGSDPSSPTMYPVDYNWTDQMYYVGRERLGVEYLGPALVEQVLDHWAFGPHHVWSVPDTGEIRRMWQPYNGLQVLQNGTNDHTVNTSLFDDVPPALCKIHGATMRIGCNDDGYPLPPNKTAPTAAVSQSNKQFDVERAEQPKPRAHYRGESFQHMSLVR